MLTATIKNNKIVPLVFIVSLVVFAFYFTVYTQVIDVYKYAVVGAIYELLWLPMLLSLVLVPLVSAIVFVKQEGKARIYSILAILFIIGSIVIMTNR
jgi:hypothetical protein